MCRYDRIIWMYVHNDMRGDATVAIGWESLDETERN
jgi:hypothetical protein